MQQIWRFLSDCLFIDFIFNVVSRINRLCRFPNNIKFDQQSYLVEFLMLATSHINDISYSVGILFNLVQAPLWIRQGVGLIHD